MLELRCEDVALVTRGEYKGRLVIVIIGTTEDNDNIILAETSDEISSMTFSTDDLYYVGNL